MRFGKGAEEKAQRTPLVHALKITKRILFYLLLLGFVLLYFQCGLYRVALNNDSMSPDFPPGSQVIYDRLFKYHDKGVPRFSAGYTNIKPNRIIIFTKKFPDFTYTGIGRVIAVPGDSLIFGKNSIVVGNRTYHAEHNRPPETLIVPENSFFVLNDNLASPVNDSRHFGFIHLNEIEGVVLFSLGSVFRSFSEK
ncbi:MAG: signal peptidase I [Planctomycetota bacterium]|nr:signal peptidase I [Planctomycetota bacterium]